MRALALFIATESLNLRKPRLNLISTRKGNPNPERQQKTRLSVDRAVDRAVDRSLPRSTGRSTGLTLCTSCTPVDRPPPPVDRVADREHNLACSMLCFSLLWFSISVLASSTPLSPLSLHSVFKDSRTGHESARTKIGEFSLDSYKNRKFLFLVLLGVTVVCL